LPNPTDWRMIKKDLLLEFERVAGWQEQDLLPERN
jgi:hypothetical protein